MPKLRTRGAPAVTLGRCNFSGAETGGPKRILGGLYGPNSARLPDAPEYAGIPENIMQGEWPCPWPAAVRIRMICRCEHRGQVTALCSWHDEDNWRGEYVAGAIRQVRETVRVRGHFEEIQRRMSDFCPPCGWPDASRSGNGIDYAALQKEWDSIGSALHASWQASGGSMTFFHLPRARSLQQRRDDIGRMFDEGRELGVIHNCPLTLVPVS